MRNFIHDIPSIDFFLILFVLLSGSVALQAYLHKRDLTYEDQKIIFQWISKWVIGLVLLAVGLTILALLAK